MNGVYLLEQRYGKNRLSFLTLTLPDLTSEDLLKCSENWGRMTDELLKALRKYVEYTKKGIFEYVYCTEIQTKRLELRGEYAPHIHIVMLGKDGKNWYITPKKIRSIWATIIARCVGHRSFDTSALENLQRIRRSAAAYLGKYLSKGIFKQQDTTGESEKQGKIHTQWGGMSRVISRLIKSCTIRITTEGSSREHLLAFLKNTDNLVEQGYLKFYREVIIPMDGLDSDGNPRGLKAGYGLLSVPTYVGGLAAIFSYLEEECMC
jgi:hypothetical protein